MQGKSREGRGAGWQYLPRLSHLHLESRTLAPSITWKQSTRLKPAARAPHCQAALHQQPIEAPHEGPNADGHNERQAIAAANEYRTALRTGSVQNDPQQRCLPSTSRDPTPPHVLGLPYRWCRCRKAPHPSRRLCLWPLPPPSDRCQMVRLRERQAHQCPESCRYRHMRLPQNVSLRVGCNCALAT